VLTLTHEDDDEVEEFTLAPLAEMDPEKFAQFALLRPSPERVEAGLTLVNMFNSGGDVDAGAFPLFLSTIQLDFVCAVGPAPEPEGPAPEPEGPAPSVDAADAGGAVAGAGVGAGVDTAAAMRARIAQDVADALAQRDYLLATSSSAAGAFPFLYIY
jgi:hypothetical protein